MVKLFLIAVLTIFCLRNAEGHTYHLGGCPDIEPLQGFQMDRMLGLWYVIQKTSTGSSCVTYNFTRTNGPNEYELVQVSEHFAIPVKNQYHYTGHITIPDSSVPGKMTIKFPLNVAGSSTFTVFSTDYETYAGIFTCQKLTFAHRQSATILSRRKTLDKMYLDKLRSKLSQANIDPFDLSIVSQTDCPDQGEGYNINIDSDTFSAQNAAGVIRKAGEKLGDGVEYLADGAKNVYHKVSSDASVEGHRIQEGVNQFGDRARHNIDYATGRAREDVNYYAERARDDMNYYGNRARQGADNLNTRLRDDVEYINDRVRNPNRQRDYYMSQPTTERSDVAYDWLS